MNSERHPLDPFLPSGARLLMLGSFPPQRKRWSMEFFYPNLQNDMWRVVGYLATGDKQHFLTPDRKHFDRERIEAFCRERGIALFDTAVEVIRLKDNASDNFLQVVQEVDFALLLTQLPDCRAVVTTGQKATDTLRRLTGCDEPPWAGVLRCPLPDATCSSGACPPPRGPTRARWSGRRSFTAGYSPGTASSDRPHRSPTPKKIGLRLCTGAEKPVSLLAIQYSI